MIYKINKDVLLQEDISTIVKEGIKKHFNLGKPQDDKDYKVIPEGQMGTREDFENNIKYNNQFGTHSLSDKLGQ